MFRSQAVSPGLIESDIVKENANDELVNIMPALQAKDVAAAVIYAISVKNNVQVRYYDIDKELKLIYYYF